MEITYDYYRIFYYVAMYKSFSKAAKVLMSNQPNITHFMNNLENQLGCKLFVRSNRGVTLTAEGEKLYQHVSVAYQHLHAAEAELAMERSMESGSITISASEIALHLLLLPILGRFHKQYPGVRLRLLNHSTPEAVESVKNGLADFAVVTTPLQAKKPLISLGQGSTTYEFYSKFFLENDLVLSPDTEVETIDQVLPLIMNGLGIGFLPELFVRPVIEEGKVCQIPLKENIPEREICLVENHTFPPSIAAEMFKKMLVLK